jgi:hypothetical protein
MFTYLCIIQLCTLGSKLYERKIIFIHCSKAYSHSIEVCNAELEDAKLCWCHFMKKLGRCGKENGFFLTGQRTVECHEILWKPGVKSLDFMYPQGQVYTPILFLSL